MDTEKTKEDSAMIALLPKNDEWCSIKLPHMTLVYAGPIKKLKSTDFNELAKDTATLATLSRPLILRVVAREQFGGGSDKVVDAFRLQPRPEIWAMRRMVEGWNASEHPFSPHVTIGPVGSVVEEVPKYIVFDRLLVAWGDEHINFWLKQ